MTSVRDLLVSEENEASLASRARRRRWDELLLHFPDLSDLTVVDLGGRPGAWRGSPVMPRSIVYVNLEPLEPVSGDHEEQVITADACSVDGIGHFDLVYSNSTIEHVGGHERCIEFADNVRKLGERYWVQTPYRYFPVEPHIVFPFAQFLPTPVQVSICRHWKPSYIAADPHEVMSIDLLGLTQLRAYFPEATIVKERFAGLVKSLIATNSKD
jgi:hypothetical protein